MALETRVAGPAATAVETKPTVPFEPPLRLHETDKAEAEGEVQPARCHQAVQSVVFPIPTATEKATTSYFVGTVCEPASTKTPRKTTSSSVLMVPTTMSTMVLTAASAGLTAIPAISTPTDNTSMPAALQDEPLMTTRAIVLVVLLAVLALVTLGCVVFTILRCRRARKQAEHDKTSSFWRKIFAPAQATNRDITLDTLPPPVTAPSSSAFPRSYTLSSTNPYTSTDPATGFPPTNQPSQQPPPPKSKLSTFKSTLKDKAHLTSSKVNPFPLSRATELQRIMHAQARAQDNNNNDPGHGAGGDIGFSKKVDADEMVEICLDEDLALEELTKEDDRRIDEMATWAEKKKSFSPYPLPFRPPTPPPKGGKNGVPYSVNAVAKEKSRWSGGI